MDHVCRETLVTMLSLISTHYVIHMDGENSDAQIMCECLALFPLDHYGSEYDL